MKKSYATNRNGMHMLCPIQTHIHTNISSMKTLTIEDIFEK
jgi:hypothetical protein